MKISLSSHVVTEVVGDQLLVLDSTTQSVYSLALADVIDHSEDFQSLTVSEAAESIAAGLCEQGLATATSAGVSRRALVGTGAAVVGAGLLTLSLPTAAAASSAGGGSSSGFRLTRSSDTFTVGYGAGTFQIFVFGNVGGASNVSLTHTFPNSFIATSPVGLKAPGGLVITPAYNSATDRTVFQFDNLATDGSIPAGPWDFELSYDFSGETQKLSATYALIQS
jgi:hypothetical protein